MEKSGSLVPSTFGTKHTSIYEFGDINVSVCHNDAPKTQQISFNEVVNSRLEMVDGHRGKEKDLSGSNTPVGNMHTTVTIGYDRSYHTTFWARKSEFGSVASNQDRSTPHVQMLRYWDGVCYLGRADTNYRLNEQVEFILETERTAGPPQIGSIKGMELEKGGNYTFTYAVNSLTKHGKAEWLSPLSERESLIKEKELLSEENTIEFNDYNIKLNPIHIHQSISGAGEVASYLFNDNISGKKLEREINDKGYAALFAQIEKMEDGDNKNLANLLKDQLQNPQALSLREKFIFTDLLQRLVGLIAVYHCKSSVDRGGTAAAIGATNAYFLPFANLKSIEDVKKLIDSDDYRKMFLAQLCRAHQETLPARFGIDEQGNVTGKKKLGLKMYGSLLTDSLPKNMVKETLWETSPGVRKLVASVLTVAYVIFYPIIIAFMFSIGHLLLGSFQLGVFLTKGGSIAKKLGVFHAIPYSLTPWNIHKAVHKHIDYSNNSPLKSYSIVA
jgi:hypothetical protein